MTSVYELYINWSDWGDPKYSVFIFFQLIFRELIKMVEELEKTESTWKMHPSAARNKQLLKKWKSQLKVIKNSIFLIFPIGFCIPIIFSNLNLNSMTI